MGYFTKYNGKIELTNETVIKLINYMLDNSDSDDYNLHLFDSYLENNILYIEEDRKNYDEEMEFIFSLICEFDKNATGEIISEGEDGEGKERFIIKKGNLFREEGYIAYKNIKNITIKTSEKEINNLKENLNIFEKERICEKCGKKIDKKFIFKNRGYYKEIIKELNFNELCENCYKQIKIPFVEIKKLDIAKDKLNKDINNFKK